MGIVEVGAMSLSEADDANIPVCCLLMGPKDESDNVWRWQADNYMPRRGRVAEAQYEIQADSKEAILDAVRKYVVPLYETAVRNLKENGDLYYWQ